MAVTAWEFLAMHRIPMAPSLPYSPDMVVPWNIFILFPRLKVSLHWKWFQDAVDIKLNMMQHLQVIPKQAYHTYSLTYLHHGEESFLKIYLAPS